VSEVGYFYFIVENEWSEFENKYNYSIKDSNYKDSLHHRLCYLNLKHGIIFIAAHWFDTWSKEDKK
jgi:hypothetical protein